MKSIKFYNIMLYGFTLLVTMLSLVFVDYVDPAFYTYDMCSKSFMDSKGHPNLYDRSNSLELINACYTVKNIFLNPIIQFVTVYGFSIVIVRFMFLGSKKEFLKENPIEIHSRFYHEQGTININSLNCNTCRYKANHEDELENHLRLTGHKRQSKPEVNHK